MSSALCRSCCTGRPKCIETASRSATREVTYSDLWERTGNLAGHLQNEGVRHGDTVVLLVSNGVALVES
jgi:acyl-CoA synthetase (AMP-forming)/AMP-acid ligase II